MSGEKEAEAFLSEETGARPKRPPSARLQILTIVVSMIGFFLMLSSRHAIHEWGGRDYLSPYDVNRTAIYINSSRIGSSSSPTDPLDDQEQRSSSSGPASLSSSSSSSSSSMPFSSSINETHNQDNSFRDSRKVGSWSKDEPKSIHDVDKKKDANTSEDSSSSTPNKSPLPPPQKAPSTNASTSLPSTSKAEENYEKLTNRLDSFSCRLENETYTFPPFPSFIIVGAQKGGTSAMYSLLKMIPGIQASNRFENHLFDNWIFDPEEYTEADICRLRKFYFESFRRDDWDKGDRTAYDNVLTFEKTPIYMSQTNIAKNIATTIYPKPKILIALRNPVDRAFSQYKMTFVSNELNNRNRMIAAKTEEEKQKVRAKMKTIRPFGYYMEKTIRQMRQQKWTNMPDYDNQVDWETVDLPEVDDQPLPPDYRKQTHFTGEIKRGLYVPQVAAYLEYWTLDIDLKIVTFQDLNDNPSQTLSSILEFVGASPDHRLSDAQLKADLSPFSKANKKDSSISSPPKLDNSTRSYLNRFYRPYNNDLADLLGDDRYRTMWE